MRIPFSSPIVGGRFRPPAAEVLNMLPQGTKLKLQREPDNQYDPNAIRVELLESPEHKALLDECFLPYSGDEPNLQQNAFPFHLGYVPKPKAEMLAPMLDGLVSCIEAGNSVEGTLEFSLEGRPTVDFEIEDEMDSERQALHDMTIDDDKS